MTVAGKEHPDLWRVLSNEDGDRSVMTTDHSPESIRRACCAIANDQFGRHDDDELNDWLVAHARTVTWRQHTKEPDGLGCWCEEVGWYCPAGNSRKRYPFVLIDSDEMHLAWENFG